MNAARHAVALAGLLSCARSPGDAGAGSGSTPAEIRQTLRAGAGRVVPLLKPQAVIAAIDLGAIGPKRVVAMRRPWRKEVVPGLYAVLAVREPGQPDRLWTEHQIASSTVPPEAWLTRAVSNLERRLGATPRRELRDAEGRLSVVELGAAGDRAATSSAAAAENTSALLLSERLRTHWLDRFGVEELGVAVPSRDAVVLFRADDALARKPVRARVRVPDSPKALPVFRGLLSITRNGLGILEPP